MPLKVFWTLVIVTIIWGCNNGPQKSEEKPEITSVETKFQQGKIEVDSLYDVGLDLRSDNSDSAKKIAEVMIQKSKESNYLPGLANAYNLLGGIYRLQGTYDTAIENYYLCLDYLAKINDTTKVGKTEVAKVSVNIGTVFSDQKNYVKAFEFYSKALVVFEKNKDSAKIFLTYNNIGIVFDDQKKYDQALTFYSNSLQISEKIGDKDGISMSYNNIGNVHRKKGDYNKALIYFSKSLILKKELGDRVGIARLLMNVGTVYNKQKKHSAALAKVEEGLKISQEIGNKQLVKENYLILSEIYDEMNDCSKAYEYYQLYTEINNSLLNQESAKQVAEMAVKHETEKKEKENETLREKNARQQAENSRQKVIIYATVAGVVLVFLSALIIFRSFKKEQKAKILIKHQAKEITDSIVYAKRIQQAILPSMSSITVAFPKSFVFFQPKDVVSGDFYWLYQAEDESAVFLAAADCTGHGVPGSMMSMVCSKALNRSVKEFGLTEPAKILEKAKELVIETFVLSEENIQDGMDTPLVRWDAATRVLQFAGANRPLWIIRNGSAELEEIKGTKMPIGKSDKKEKFVGHEFQLKPGDTFYLSSDGYADQFGGPDGKRLMTKEFKKLLLSIQEMDMGEQKKYLVSYMENWRKAGSEEAEQVDDILVIGMRV